MRGRSGSFTINIPACFISRRLRLVKDGAHQYPLLRRKLAVTSDLETVWCYSSKTVCPTSCIIHLAYHNKRNEGKAKTQYLHCTITLTSKQPLRSERIVLSNNIQADTKYRIPCLNPFIVNTLAWLKTHHMILSIHDVQTLTL